MKKGINVSRIIEEMDFGIDVSNGSFNFSQLSLSKVICGKAQFPTSKLNFYESLDITFFLY